MQLLCLDPPGNHLGTSKPKELQKLSVCQKITESLYHLSYRHSHGGGDICELFLSDWLPTATDIYKDRMLGIGIV